MIDGPGREKALPLTSMKVEPSSETSGINQVAAYQKAEPPEACLGHSRGQGQDPPGHLVPRLGMS